jgi:homocysteine S-methyltransferase
VSYRDHLPQLDGGLFLTDGGIETTLIFHRGLDLPARPPARRGFVLESPTWRASPDWATELGYSG